MANKKLKDRVILFTQIESDTKEKLRSIAYSDRTSLAEVVRKAIDEYIKRQKLGLL